MASVDAENVNIDCAKENSATTINAFSQVPRINVNCVDVNGIKSRDVCDLLPNNNECRDVRLSQCNNDGSCVSSDNSFSSPEARNSSSLESEASSVNAEGRLEFVIRSGASITFDWNADGTSQESEYREEVYRMESTSSHFGYGLPEESIKNGAFKKARKTEKKQLAATRGRPRKSLIPMYHSQISGDKNTIKIRIKKSNLNVPVCLSFSRTTFF